MHKFKLEKTRCRLMEATLQNLQGKYSNIPEDVINYIIDIDPTKGQRPVGKLAPQLLALLSKSKDISYSDFTWNLGTKIEEALGLYKTYYNKKDFSTLKYTRIEDYDDITDFILDCTVGAEDNPILFEDDEWLIRELNSKNACMYYMPEPKYKWCVSNKDGTHYQENYHKGIGDLYFIQDKSNDTQSTLLFVKESANLNVGNWLLPKNVDLPEPWYKYFEGTTMLQFLYSKGILSAPATIMDINNKPIQYIIKSNQALFSGNVSISMETYQDLPNLIGNHSIDIKGYLTVSGETNASDLIGLLIIVHGNVKISGCSVQSLKGIPYSHDSYNLHNLQGLTNLEGLPQPSHSSDPPLDSIYIENCSISSLKGLSPVKKLQLYVLPNLKSLKHIPEQLLDLTLYQTEINSFEGLPKVMRNIDVTKGSMVHSLKGSPVEVDEYTVRGDFTSLVGGPEIVNGEYFIYNSNLESIEGAPKILESTVEILSYDGLDGFGYNDWIDSLDELTSPTMDNEVVLKYVQDLVPCAEHDDLDDDSYNVYMEPDILFNNKTEFENHNVYLSDLNIKSPFYTIEVSNQMENVHHVDEDEDITYWTQVAITFTIDSDIPERILPRIKRDMEAVLEKAEDY